jgi:hypothetical protein
MWHFVDDVEGICLPQILMSNYDSVVCESQEAFVTFISQAFEHSWPVHWQR